MLKSFRISCVNYDFLNNSSLCTAGLQAIETLVNEKGQLLAPCLTRWLSTELSVTRLKSCYVAVVATRRAI